ncbi:MAG: SurA N-terminal domain-containing protein [Deltaproteobacteria bacterium]|nr:SurA N-terminal domain-containing protein [Deltaproteobacteria bacterium]
MLDVMRRHSKSTLIYVLFGMLIAVFVLTFNTASRTGAGAGEAEVMATVDGATIDAATLNLAMMLSTDPPPPNADKFEKWQAEQQYEKTRLRHSGGYPEAMALVPHAGKPSPVKVEKVMAELVEGVLVAKDAVRHGLGVSDTELAKRVVALQRVFGQDLLDESGNFDPRKYDQFVRFRLQTSKAALEEFLRREILRDKMAQIVTQGIVVAPAEVDALSAADASRPRLEVLTLDATSAAKAVTVTSEEAAAWAASHADAVAAEYAAQASKYKVPDKFNIRGILVAAPSAEDETDEAKKQSATDARAAKKADAQAIRAELDKAWAGEVRLAPVPPKSDDPDKPAEAVGDPKTATEVTGQERSDRLLHHFSKLAEQKTEDSVYKDAGGKYVEDYDAERLDRQPFGPAVKAAVAGAKELDLAGPVEGKKGWWVLVIEKKIAGRETPLDAARDEIAKGLMAKDKAAKELDGIASAVLAAAQATPTTALPDVVKKWCKDRGLAEDALAAFEAPPMGKSPMESLSDLSALFGSAPKIDDPEAVPGVGRHPELAKAAAQLKAGAPIAPKVFHSEDGKTRYVVRLANARPSDAANDAKLKDNLAKTLTGIRRIEAYRAYATKLIADATKAGLVQTSEAYAQKLKEERARWDDQVKKASAEGSAAPPPTGAPPAVQLNVGGKPVEVKLDKPEPAGTPPATGSAPAPAGDAPAK